MDYFFSTFLIKIDMSQTREHSTQTVQSSPVGCSRRVHKIVYLFLFIIKCHIELQPSHDDCAVRAQ